MKKILGLFFLCISVIGFSQVDPNTPVIAINTGNTVTQMYHLGKIMEQMKDISEKAKKVAESAKFIQDMKNVQRTIKLLDQLICNSKKLEIYLGFTSLYNSCLGNINVQLSLVNLQGSFDMINLILSSDVFMNPGDRVKNWNDALDRLEKAQKEIAALNTKIRNALQQDVVTQYQNRQTAIFNSMSRY